MMIEEKVPFPIHPSTYESSVVVMQELGQEKHEGNNTSKKIQPSSPSNSSLTIIPPPLSWFQLSDSIYTSQNDCQTVSPPITTPAAAAPTVETSKTNSTIHGNHHVHTKKNSKSNSRHQHLSKKSYSTTTSTNVYAVQRFTVETLPTAAQELISNSFRRAYYYTRIAYAHSNFFGKQTLRHSEVGSNLGGYNRKKIVRDQGIRDPTTGEILWGFPHDDNAYTEETEDENKKFQANKENTRSMEPHIHTFVCNTLPAQTKFDDPLNDIQLSLPAFSSLSWVHRQLVQEWRTCDYAKPSSFSSHESTMHIDQMDQKNYMQRKEGDHFLHASIQDDDLAFIVDEPDTNSNDYECNISHNHYSAGIDTISDTKIENCDFRKEEYHLDTVSDQGDNIKDDEEQEDCFEQAKILIPQPLPRPPWEKAISCYVCKHIFGPTLLRHHCRLCGRSYCHPHSRFVHRLPHLGYDPDIPERVCGPCKHALDGQNLAERIAWRMARVRDYFSGDLRPYFDTGVDTLENAVCRVTRAVLKIAKKVPLGAQASIAVETLDILRKHGLKGIYGLILRREFLEAADLLCKVTGINKKTFPLSFSELTAAIFYALAQNRFLRGVDPEREHRLHSLRVPHSSSDEVTTAMQGSHQREVIDFSDEYDPTSENVPQLLAKAEAAFKEYRSVPNNDDYPVILCQGHPTVGPDEDKCQRHAAFLPVCEYVQDALLASLIFYAPVALNFMYATNEVDVQILAAQQGWRLIYCYLQQNDNPNSDKFAEMPGFALFVHAEHKIACLSIRGTVTINDVVTDIRATPVNFPESDRFSFHHEHASGEFSDTLDGECWTSVNNGQGLALCGMAGAAYNLFHENIDALVLYARKGYRIRITGHSLGGSVAALLGSLVRHHLKLRFYDINKIGQIRCKDSVRVELDELLRVYSYGSPACVDAKLSDFCQSFVTSCVCHDDVVPRLTPTSIRGLLKHLLFIKSTWVCKNLSSDIHAITQRVKSGWAPKFRNGFTLLSASTSSLKLCKRRLKAKRRHITQPISRLTNPCDQKDAVPQQSIKDCYTSQQLHGVKAGKAEDSGCGEMYYDGDCFYEAEEDLTEYSYEEIACGEKINNFSDNEDGVRQPFDVSINNCTSLKSTDSCTENVPDKVEDLNEFRHAVVMEELPLPRMYLPGKIVHVYTHRGGYKAALVPKTFRELRRISLAGNMLNDHLGGTYYSSLLECMSIRKAPEHLPEWTGFNEETTCSCCSSSFTWASTSDSEAQEARDKHNCRSCGSLVCDECSKNRTALPSIGITVPVRVCNACYNNLQTRLGDPSALTRSFIEEKASCSLSIDMQLNTRNDCRSSKRDTLIDELAGSVFS